MIKILILIEPVRFFACCSTDSGWDNPFRPDGDLSKEADEIVELIREGKPITPTQSTNPAGKLPEENGSAVKQSAPSANAAAPAKANGSAPTESPVVTGVEVQHCTTARPTDASQVEHVVIKKKPKCKCCTIQ